jgi:hypothetical protein
MARELLSSAKVKPAKVRMHVDGGGLYLHGDAEQSWQANEQELANCLQIADHQQAARDSLDIIGLGKAHHAALEASKLVLNLVANQRNSGVAIGLRLYNIPTYLIVWCGRDRVSRPSPCSSQASLAGADRELEFASGHQLDPPQRRGDPGHIRCSCQRSPSSRILPSILIKKKLTAPSVRHRTVARRRVATS